MNAKKAKELRRQLRRPDDESAAAHEMLKVIFKDAKWPSKRQMGRAFRLAKRWRTKHGV